MTNSFVDLLGIQSGDVVAFVGGGGKSTLVLETGRELASAGRSVVMATTTKMGVDQIPDWAAVCQTAAEVEAALAAGRPVYLLHRAEKAKVIGVDPDLVDAVAATTRATVLIEADGSRGKPFKAPANHEPVIPTSVTLVVVVVGADALARPIGETVHRPERVAALTRLSITDAVTPEAVGAVVGHPAGGRHNAPSGARLMLALTKVEPHHSDAVARIRAALAPDIELVPINSR
ncbi:MAG: putative selenium-dependent hydroxylase accessory protein YqeC [bacterium]|nr:putative selenium-dependent hydroxylase accessory protein YqeC [bacterium]